MNHVKVINLYEKRNTDFTGSVIDEGGNISYYVNGKIHREAEPAIEYDDGDKQWYLHGKRHREDGPAIEYSNGDKEWWYSYELISDDFDYTLEDFQREIKLRIFK